LLSTVADDRLVDSALDLHANYAARRVIDNFELELAFVVRLSPEAPIQDNGQVRTLGSAYHVEPPCCDSGNGNVRCGEGEAWE
jgi:hypothetical protein